MADLTSKMASYQTILTNLVDQLAQERNTSPGAILEYQAIADKTHNHFQLTRVGWHNRKFHFLVLLHLDLKADGKIWLQQNNSEIRLEDLLFEKGVEKSDLILGFRPDWMRALAAEEVAA